MLPDWRPALTPQQLKPAASVMSVRYRGVTYRITYTPGPDGLEHFLATLQAIGIKVASASQVTFLCRSPDTGVCCCCLALLKHRFGALLRHWQSAVWLLVLLVGHMCGCRAVSQRFEGPCMLLAQLWLHSAWCMWLLHGCE